MSRLHVGDIVRVVNPRTWPFLEEGQLWSVSRVHPNGFVKLEGQPVAFASTMYGDAPLIDWLPDDTFERIDT